MGGGEEQVFREGFGEDTGTLKTIFSSDLSPDWGLWLFSFRPCVSEPSWGLACLRS